VTELNSRDFHVRPPSHKKNNVLFTTLVLFPRQFWGLKKNSSSLMRQSGWGNTKKRVDTVCAPNAWARPRLTFCGCAGAAPASSLSAETTHWNITGLEIGGGAAVAARCGAAHRGAGQGATQGARTNSSSLYFPLCGGSIMSVLPTIPVILL